MRLRPVILLLLGLTCMSGRVLADDIGHVNTQFRVLGPDNQIRVASFADPKVGGVSCFIARATTGGVKGALGLAEDTSDASIACRQTGPITFSDAIGGRDKGEEVFSERRSILFKHLHVTRFWDAASQTLVYLTWSDRLTNGSPKNSISAVTLAPWGNVAAQPVKIK